LRYSSQTALMKYFLFFDDSSKSRALFFTSLVTCSTTSKSISCSPMVGNCWKAYFKQRVFKVRIRIRNSSHLEPRKLVSPLWLHDRLALNFGNTFLMATCQSNFKEYFHFFFFFFSKNTSFLREMIENKIRKLPLGGSSNSSLGIWMGIKRRTYQQTSKQANKR